MEVELLCTQIETRIPKAKPKVSSIGRFSNQPAIWISLNSLIEVGEYLKGLDDPFSKLITMNSFWLQGVCVVTILLESRQDASRLFLRFTLKDTRNPVLPKVDAIWPEANFHYDELVELNGIMVEGFASRGVYVTQATMEQVR